MRLNAGTSQLPMSRARTTKHLWVTLSSAMKFVGASVAILCQLNPDHKHFVTIENSLEVLYVYLMHQGSLWLRQVCPPLV